MEKRQDQAVMRIRIKHKVNFHLAFASCTDLTNAIVCVCLNIK